MSPYLPAGIYCHKLCIPASSLRHALINGAFSVLFKKRGRSVLCVISESFVCLFLYRFIKRFKGLFLVTFLESRYQHWPYRELVVCLTLLKRTKTESLCK